MRAFVRVEVQIEDDGWAGGKELDRLNNGMIELSWGDLNAFRAFGRMPQSERVAIVLAGMKARKEEDK